MNMPGARTAGYLNKGRAAAKLDSDQKFYKMAKQENLPGRKAGGEAYRNKAKKAGWEWGSKNFTVHNNKKLHFPWIRKSLSANKYGIQ